MSFAKRLKELRVEKKLTQAELSSITGISVSSISMYENGNRIPELETFESLADFFNVDMDYLKGKSSTRRKVDMKETNPNPLAPIHYKKQIPILGRISAGLPLLAMEHIESYENVEDESLDYGLIVKGDSMIGARIFEDDIVYVTREADISNGDIVIALINGDDATIKRFYKYDNEVILKPENPTMKEQHYKPEEVQLLGKVKQVKFDL